MSSKVGVSFLGVAVVMVDEEGRGELYQSVFLFCTETEGVCMHVCERV